MDEKNKRKCRRILATRVNDDKIALRLYDAVIAAVENVPGGLTDASEHLAYLVAESEHLAEMYRADIARHGVRETWSNGRQRGERENKSCAALRATMETQRKLLSELKLTPASLKWDAPDPAGGMLDDF